MILGYTFPYCYEELIRQDIRPAVFRRDMLKELNDCAARLGKKAVVHVKVDTGMSRIGIQPDEQGICFLEWAAGLRHVDMEGIFTHLPGPMRRTKAARKNSFCCSMTLQRKRRSDMGREIPN